MRDTSPPALVLYLDYDGTLHPHDVRRRRGKPPCVFVDDEPSSLPLFEHVPLLEQLLNPHPEVRIVLSTSWVRHLSFHRARARLSPALQARVIGATWHTSMRRQDDGSLHAEGIRFDTLTRFQTIAEDVVRRGQPRWIALDDDVHGWPQDQLHRLVAPTDPMLGLAQPGMAERLARALNWLCAARTE
jgi:hypothetical protein